MKNNVKDHANDNQNDEQCLKKIMNQCFHKLFCFKRTECDIAEDQREWERKPKDSRDNPKFYEPHIFKRVFICIIRNLIISVHKGVPIAFID